MRREPIHCTADAVPDLPAGQGGSVDQNDGNPQVSCGGQFRFRAGTARVLRDKVGDGIVPQQGAVSSNIKGASGNHGADVLQWQVQFRRINQAQKVVMLRFSGKGRNGLLTDCKKNAASGIRQGLDRMRHSRNQRPTVACFGLPRFSFKRQQGDVRLGAGRNCISAHLIGKRVSRVDDMRDSLFSQVFDQTLYTTEPAYARWQRLNGPRSCAPSIGKYGPELPLRNRCGKVRCFCSAAENQEVRHG